MSDAIDRLQSAPAETFSDVAQRLVAAPPRWLAPAAVFFAAFLLFAPSFGAAFAVLDFNHLDAIRANDASTYFARIFDPSDGGRTIIGTGDLYRPLYYTMFWFQYQAFGTDPMPYYLCNATLHAVNAVLVFLLAWRLTRSTLASLAGALVWSFHPQYADTVAWVSSTTDLLLVTFGVGAVLLYASAVDARGGRRWLLYGASFAATLLALGAKETGMAVIVIIASYHLLIGEPGLLRSRRVPWELAPFAVLLIGYVVVRMALVGNLASEQDSRLLTWDFFRNVHRLSALAAGPIAGQEVSSSDYGVAQGAAGLALIAAVLFAVVRGSRREWFLGGWYLVALAPVLVLPPEWLVGRYLYLPMAGLALLAGIGVARAIEAVPRRAGSFARPIAGAALLAGVAIWFAVLNAGYQHWLTTKGDDAEAFLVDLQAAHLSLPEGSRLIVTEYPGTLSLFPDDGYMLRPAVRLTYGQDVEVITQSQIDSGAVPPLREGDVVFPVPIR